MRLKVTGITILLTCMTVVSSAAGDRPDLRGGENCLDLLGWYPLKLLGMTDGRSLNEIRGVLGEPLSASSRTEPDREEGVVKAVIRLEYVSFDLEVFRTHLPAETPPSKPIYWLEKFVVRHPNLEAMGCDDMGSDQREIEARLGPADDMNAWIWFGEWRQGEFHWASYATIRLQFDTEEELSAIEWEYWAD